MNLVVGNTYISDIFPTDRFTLDYVGVHVVVVTDEDHEEHTFLREWFESSTKEVPVTITVEGYINKTGNAFLSKEEIDKFISAGVVPPAMGPKVRAVFTIIEE